MIGPFDVTKQQIGALDDRQLRDLLMHLLEAEARRREIPLSSIDVGGAQTAPDGGIDARMTWTGTPAPGDWLPARDIVFQCKATEMSPQACVMEIAPGGMLRAFFGDLLAADGAYILVTTRDMGNDAATRRIGAMRKALDGFDPDGRIAIHIYAADRLARWTNTHVGVAMWVRESAGLSLNGWRPYERWSKGDGQPYIADEKARVRIGPSRTTSFVGEDDAASGTEPIYAAIDAIRRTLDVPRGVARLVGISGMGKTRLAEALFENSVFANVPPLSPSLAVYGDLSVNSLAPPGIVAERIVASGERAVLIVDNCSDKLHADLADVVSRQHSNVSLLTIDYDVEGELSVGTVLVRLGDNSDGALGTLIARRFPQLSNVQRDKLVEFAGGNARIAIAIARGVSEHDTLSALDDVGLLDRLFQAERRGGGDDTVRPSAEASALVYAFHADKGIDTPVELPVLADLVEQSSATFYRAVGRMLDFGIAQQRGTQRAIKPDALADRLAEMRLRTEDPARLVAAFSAGPTRLFASFARRLGRLHQSPKARRIAEMLLAPGGWLGDITSYDERQGYAFTHIAPAAREAAIAAIERVSGVVDWRSIKDPRAYADTLAHIAWDKALFSRAMHAMVPLVLSEAADKKDEQVRGLFLERFRPGLSFTMADDTVRLEVIDTMLDDPRDMVNELAIDALDAMLEVMNVSSSFHVDFGTRDQLREWRWQSVSDRDAWFDQVYRRLEALVARGGPLVQRARAIVATNARANIAAGSGMRTIAALRTVRDDGYWDAGWREVNEVLHFDRGSLPVDLRAEIEQLEREFRPQDGGEAFEAFVLGEPWRHWHPRGDERRHMRNIALLARGCGVRMASSNDLARYLACATEAKYGQGPARFGAGVASRTANLELLWTNAVDAFRAAPEAVRNASLLSGILDEARHRDRAWLATKIEQVVADTDLAPHSVQLIPRDAFDTATVDRLVEALEERRMSPGQLGGLMYGGVSGGIDAVDLARLLVRMIDDPVGAVPALAVLNMRIYADRQEKKPVAPVLLDVARCLLVDARVYLGERQHTDHELGNLAKLLFPDEELARAIARTMVAANRDDRWYARDFSDLKKLIVQHHPFVALDELLGDIDRGRGLDGVFGNRFSDDANLADDELSLDPAVVRRWVMVDPQPRAERLAEVIPYAVGTEGALAWSPVALTLIDLAPDRLRVLEALADRFYTGSSTGPFYLRWVRRLPMIEGLIADSDPEIRTWARERKATLERLIERDQERERDDDSRFEP